MLRSGLSGTVLAKTVHAVGLQEELGTGASHAGMSPPNDQSERLLAFHANRASEIWLG